MNQLTLGQDHFKTRLPMLAVQSRFGAPGTFLKRLVARAIRFHIIYQASVNEQLDSHLRQLSKRVEANERTLEQVAVLWSRISAIDASLAQTRYALSTLSSSLSQQIAQLDTRIAISHDSVEALRLEQAGLSERIVTLAGNSASLQAELASICADLQSRFSALHNERVVEITTSHFDETTVRFAEDGHGSTTVGEKPLPALFDSEISIADQYDTVDALINDDTPETAALLHVEQAVDADISGPALQNAPAHNRRFVGLFRALEMLLTKPRNQRKR